MADEPNELQQEVFLKDEKPTSPRGASTGWMTNKIFSRQLVLLDEVMALQKECLHKLYLPNSSTIACAECGSLWIK